MGRPRAGQDGQMEAKWLPKGTLKGSKNCTFEGSSKKHENLTKTYYLLYFSHIGHLRKWCFFHVLGVQKWGRKRGASKKGKNGSNILPKAYQRRSKGKNWPPTWPPGAPQNGSKIGLFRALGHRGATKGPQGLSGYPLKLKIEPKLT